jgi:hypothetical protein
MNEKQKKIIELFLDLASGQCECYRLPIQELPCWHCTLKSEMAEIPETELRELREMIKTD